MRRKQISKECICESARGILFNILLWAIGYSVWAELTSVQAALIQDRLPGGPDSAIERGGAEDLPAALHRQEVPDGQKYDD